LRKGGPGHELRGPAAEPSSPYSVECQRGLLTERTNAVDRR
jgi:hypothetical protein